jgi:hypothetical protein
MNQNHLTLYGRGCGGAPMLFHRVGVSSPVAIKVLGHNAPKIYHHHHQAMIIGSSAGHPMPTGWQNSPAAAGACPAAAWKLPGSCLEAAWNLPSSSLSSNTSCLPAQQQQQLPGSCLEAAWKLPNSSLSSSSSCLPSSSSSLSSSSSCLPSSSSSCLTSSCLEAAWQLPTCSAGWLPGGSA